MLRLSYTMLRNWELGNTDEVINIYQGKYTDIDTPEAVMGKAWDEIVGDTVKDTGKLPEEFGGLEVGDCAVQPKEEIQIDDETQLVVRPDLITPDLSTVIEIKTGKYSSGDYSRTMQLPIYLWAISQAKRGMIIHYDQYTNEHDWFLMHSTDRLKTKAENYVRLGGEQIRQFLIAEGLYGK